MSSALITGASRGFGCALAHELARRDWRLIIDARGDEELQTVASSLGSSIVTAIPGDIADPEHREELARAVHRLGRLDLLVNNASVLGPSPLPGLDHYPIEELERVLRINTVAPLALSQLLLEKVRAASGAIVNLTSDAAVEPYEGWGGYGSSKAALDQLTAILGAEQSSIRVYAFDPGDMRTAMHQAAFPGEDISDRPEPEAVVPALMRLLVEAPPSGRYRARDLRVTATEAAS